MRYSSPLSFARTFRAILATVLVAGSAYATAIEVYGVTADGVLVRFDSATPGVLDLLILGVPGIGAGETIAGLDIRPADQKLYALTIGASSVGRLYTLNPTTGAASLVGTLSVPLSGAKFGMNFQPVVGLLRVVSDNGMNIRINPATAVVITDTGLNPPTPHVVATAYTNSYFGAATTVLYDIDSGSDSLLIQGILSPNDGTLTAVGPLNVATSDIAGFDIVSLDGIDAAYATLRVGGTTGLYTVNLATGTASFVGNVLGNLPIIGLAIAPDSIFRNGFN
jgi:hypothetical protein